MHVRLTTDIGKQFVDKLQKIYKLNSHSVGYSVDCRLVGHPESCYAPTANRVAEADKDYFGLLYQGWSGKMNQQGVGPEAKLWLEYLLNPKGAFQGILPYLFHSTPKGVLEDKGFVFRNLRHPKKPVNMGLLWTFAQATRLMYENPKRMERFLHCVELLPDKDMALLCTLSVGPRDKMDGLWSPCVGAHGEPLGSYNGGFRLAGSFLAHKLQKNNNCATGRSFTCFSASDEITGTPRLLPSWVELYEKEKLRVSKS